MAHVKYNGPSDTRELSAADMRKLGADSGRKLTFRRDEPTEVPDDMLQYLLEHEALAGEFEEVDDPDRSSAPETEEVDEPMTDQTLAAQNANADEGDKVQAGGDTGSDTTTGGGNGASTSGGGTSGRGGRGGRGGTTGNGSST